jgi:hypothetical protein
MLEALGEAAASLLSLPPRNIQMITADASGCVVLSLLLRILFSPMIVEVFVLSLTHYVSMLILAYMYTFIGRT